MTEELSEAIEASGGSEDVSETPEKAESTEADSTEVQEEETQEEKEESPKELSQKEKRKKDREYKARLREEAAEANRELERATKRQERITKAGESSTPPVEKEFEDYSEYIAAKAVWKYSQESHSREAEAVGSEVEEAQRKLEHIGETEKRLVQENFAAQVADARTRYTDFDAVVTAHDAPIAKHVAEVVMQSDVGADVAYHLASNKALAAEISAMSPIEAARAIGRIEAGFSAPKSRSQSTAPDPITPVKGKASATKDPERMSFTEFVKARDAGKI